MNNNAGGRRICVLIFSMIFFAAGVGAENFPNSFCTFRDAVYAQNYSVLETMRLYTAAKRDIEKEFSEENLWLALSRCEYLMGLAFRAEGKTGEAAAFFEQGIAWAEESLAARQTSEGYRLLATNIAFLCEVRKSYGISNYDKIKENAEKALALDPQNLTASYVIAAQYVASPWPLSDVKKGLALLEEIARHNPGDMEKEDAFNLYLMLEAACIKQKKKQEALAWGEKSRELYPTNNFIRLLVK